MTFYKRSKWTGTSRGGNRVPTSQFRGLTPHWPATTENMLNLSVSQIKKRLVGWRNFHVNGRGWADIGYHFAIDGRGNIWELRGDERTGAHAPGHNSTRLGVLFIIGMSEAPNQRMIDAFHELRTMYPRAANNIRDHGRLSGQSTSCAGAAIRRLIDNGTLTRTPKPKPKPHIRPESAGEWQTVVTWNLGLGSVKGQTSWLSRRQAIADSIRKDNATVVFLQEAYWSTAIGHHGLAWLIKQLPNYQIARQKSGRVILVRNDVKVLRSGTYAPKARATGHPTKYAVFAVVEIDGIKTLVVNAHAQAGAKYSAVRRRWAEGLAAMVEASRVWAGNNTGPVGMHHVIIGGDWNGLEAADVFADYGYVLDIDNALEGSAMGIKSLNSWNAKSQLGDRIDYIMVPAKRPVEWVSQRNDSDMSDHNRQLVTLGKIT